MPQAARFGAMDAIRSNGMKLLRSMNAFVIR
jgi:hypothetical protein